jgi:hypothetical protein
MKDCDWGNTAMLESIGVASINSHVAEKHVKRAIT